ncbi:MAG TPA: hypothetical protein VGE46_04430 [Bdellovibrio sp.]
MSLRQEAKNEIKTSRPNLLRHLNIGDPAGETDSLLEDCRIETTAFADLFYDRKDLFLGPKGTGKSSIYTFFTKYLAGTLRRNKTFVVKGVAKVGAPIYTDYWTEFATFSDEDFQNFWNILFINLVYRDYVKDKDSFDVTRVSEFEGLCLRNGITLEREQADPHIVKHIIDKVKSFTAKGSGGATGASAELSVDFDSTNSSKGPNLERPARIKTREILDYLNTYLEYYDHKIWIMIDQLDQAFERHSVIEKRALHALISETISFNSDRLKLKIFLRDDVFNLVSEYKGIVNLDHLRVSLALKWEEIDLLKLVLKRLLHNADLRSLVTEIQEIDEIDNWSKDECLAIFYILFPARGSKGATFWDYLLREMRDGNYLVTPRDLIFLLDKAREAQLRLISAGEGEDTLFSKQSIEKALDQCSSNKISNYVSSEFPYLRESIDKLKLKFNKYDDVQMLEMLGGDLYEKRLAQLFSVGILHRRKEGNTIWVAPLYQRGLQVRGRRENRRIKNT